jgi:hypothetical protein
MFFMKSWTHGLLGVGAFLGMVLSLSAHHSIAAEFDLDKNVTCAGVVTRVDWMNPHTYFYLDVKNAKTGNVEKWAFQLNSPRMLNTIGWSQASIKVGDVVTASGAPSLSGSRPVYTRVIRFQDGRKLNVEVR